MTPEGRATQEAAGQEPRRSLMGDGGPCMSCGGNDGYGPAPHHTPDCYFASWEDAETEPRP